MIMLRHWLFSLFLASTATVLNAQLIEAGDTLFGNEWINFDQEYYKLKIAEDGIYRIPYSLLISAGIPADLNARHLQLWWIGKPQRIFTSTSGALQDGGFIEFYGQKNRSELDKYLFERPEKMLNPDYSLVTDTSTYFLTWQSQASLLQYEHIPNDLMGDLSPQHHTYIHRAKVVLNTTAAKPRRNLQGVALSHYQPAEGFGSIYASNHEYQLPLSALASDPSFQPRINLRLTGNLGQHQIVVHLNNELLEQLSFNGSVLVDSTITVADSRLRSSNSISVNDATGRKISIASIELAYPRSLAFDKNTRASLELLDAREGAYLELKDFTSTGSPLVYDLNAGFRLEATVQNNLIRINLPDGPNKRKVVVMDPSTEIQTVTDIQAVSFEDLDDSDAEYIIISNERLFQDGQGNNWIQAYADYRQSNPGGNYKTKIIRIQQLIDQFAFGIQMHPLSIKNFTNFISKNWRNPKILFLIGKGLDYRQDRKHRQPYEYLPVYGSPGSDNLLTSRSISSTPLIPVGRIAVRTPEQIGIYLDKIKKMEDQIANAPRTLTDRRWMKRGLHLSGGSGTGEKNLILSSLNSMAKHLSDGSMGITTRTVTKESNDVIDGTASQNVLDYINDGILLKSFFGHGATTATQFQGFEDPFFLNNSERYPIMLALGCHTGNIFTREVSLGESNVLAPEKGASIYLATSGLGFLSALDDFGLEWAKLLGSAQYGHPLATTIQHIIRTFDHSTSDAIKTLMQQITYHGDPAFVLSRDELPDYTLDHNSFQIIPEIVDRASDSFHISIDLVNIGRNLQDSVVIKITQLTPANIEIPSKTILVPTVGSLEQVMVNLAVPDREDVVGVNRLLIEIDPDNLLEEMTPGGEANNHLKNENGAFGVPFVIFESGITPMFPPPFTLYNDTEIKLIARTTNPIEAIGSYECQLDTTALFNSPLLVTETLTEQSGIISWSPMVQKIPEVVYYWRARSSDTDTIVWMESSFTYAPDRRPGFEQSHYFQFLSNQLTNLQFDSLTRRAQFATGINDFVLKIQAKRDNLGAGGFVNATRWSDFFRWDITEGITFVINNPTNQYGFYFNQNPGLYGSINRRAQEIASFPFPVKTQGDRENIINFLENDDAIPNDAIVFAYTTQANPTLQLDVDQWQADSIELDGKNLFNVFESFGAMSIRSLASEMRPYLFVFQKNKGLIDELIGASALDTIEYHHPLLKASGLGVMKSVPIGPAARWAELGSDVTVEGSDSLEVSVFGHTQEGDQDLLLSIPSGQHSTDLTSIDATQYPLLSLAATYVDTFEFDAPSLNHWTVYYEGRPDLTFDFAGSLQDGCDTIAGLTEINFPLPIANHSRHDWVDSFTLHVEVSDQANQTVDTTYLVTPVKANSSVVIPVSIDLENLSGKLLLTATINPTDLNLEHYANNNTMSKCYVRPGDQLGPVLDVLFEGKRIMDGELIPISPDILITLNDENTTSLLVDSSLFDIYYVDPTGDRIQVDIFSPEITFTPAEDSSNIATILFQPTFEVEGDYQLFVNARDNSNNQAGESTYTVHFKISNEKSVGDILPYPNPFTTSCRFLYTVHGSIIPDPISIRIYTIRGQVVKEISSEEIGPLRVGSNLTDYVWDGTDNYGDRLANGVYLYKVISESDMMHKNTDTAYFEKGLGKITILR